jgi:hypothetical protein
MATTPSGSAVGATIASLAVCQSDTCTFQSKHLPQPDTHLIVRFRDVVLQNSSAVAISYAWGDFDLQPFDIGHDAEGKTISLTLGQEWNRAEFLQTLVSLSQSFNAVWLDRLCIVQEQSMIAATIQTIPQIFRVLNTHVLMPGSLCRCLRDRVENSGLVDIAENRLDFSNPQLYEPWNKIIAKLPPWKVFFSSVESCLNSMGVCSTSTGYGLDKNCCIQTTSSWTGLPLNNANAFPREEIASRLSVHPNLMSGIPPT